VARASASRPTGAWVGVTVAGVPRSTAQTSGRDDHCGQLMKSSTQDARCSVQQRSLPKELVRSVTHRPPTWMGVRVPRVAMLGVTALPDTWGGPSPPGCDPLHPSVEWGKRSDDGQARRPPAARAPSVPSCAVSSGKLRHQEAAPVAPPERHSPGQSIFGHGKHR
jgi:hypothetical protein